MQFIVICLYQEQNFTKYDLKIKMELIVRFIVTYSILTLQRNCTIRVTCKFYGHQTIEKSPSYITMKKYPNLNLHLVELIL